MRAYLKLLCVCVLFAPGVLFAQGDAGDSGSDKTPNHFNNISIGYSTAEIYEDRVHGINVALEFFEIPQNVTIYNGFSVNAMGLFSKEIEFVCILGFGPKTYWGSSKNSMSMLLAFSPQLSLFAMPDADGKQETFTGLSVNVEAQIINIKKFSLNYLVGVHIGTKHSFTTASLNILYQLP